MQYTTHTLYNTPVVTNQPTSTATKVAIFRTYQVIWYLLGIVETVLAFRFALRLLGANPVSPFTNFVYSFSALFLLPFRGIFPAARVEGSVFEVSTLVAMAVYVVLAYGLIYLFQLVKPVRSDEVEHMVDHPHV